ncbi:hypothetical protein [Microlunatus parietis]|uniref:Uncharacterized protein n=1 Tax=Microlunatus parietis TaxID=682979 RepID=A0A7Y9LBP4_9ACTN|nr:hypothetical protein [Microlunatus parietis]NYE74039.1 hypothetical protein [Microlunatus parietis]
MNPAELRATVIGVLVVAAILGGGAWLVGLDPLKCLLIAVAVALFGSFRLFTEFGDNAGWPEPNDRGRDRGARREVARLSWTLQGHASQVDARSGRRLRTLAAETLAEHGLDLTRDEDQERCRALLGDRAYRTLAADRPHYDEFVAVLNRLEQLLAVPQREGVLH